jgi:hypothetical protein
MIGDIGFVEFQKPAMVFINAVQVGLLKRLNAGHQKIFMPPDPGFPQHGLYINTASGRIRPLAEEMKDS